MLKHIGLMFAAVLAPMVVSPCKAATMEEILSVNWNKQSLPELKRLIPDQKAAQQFVIEGRLKEPHTESDEIYRLDIDNDVLEYEFVDSKGDGGVQFVCLLDNGGRRRPTRLMVVENDHGQLKTAYLTGGEGGYGLGELRYILKDVKHDGKTEITTSDPLEPFARAEPNRLRTWSTSMLVKAVSWFNRITSSLTTTRTSRYPGVTRNSMTYCSTALHLALVQRNKNIIERASLPSKKKLRH
jgi:hypothetical protein